MVQWCPDSKRSHLCMDTESTILPFVFVDGRKYVLDETEELPEPEILGKLTPPPRNVSPSVRWRLFLCREMELLGIAVSMGILFTTGACFLFGGVFGDFSTLILVIVLPILPYTLAGIGRVYSGMRASSNHIQLLQDGLISKGRFYGMGSTGKKVDNVLEMQLKYQFTTQDGNTYNARFVADMRQVIKLSGESIKLIFYDPTQPNKHLLFDTLPKGVDFDGENGTFFTRLSYLILQMLWLCIAFSAIPVITLAVALFLC